MNQPFPPVELQIKKCCHCGLSKGLRDFYKNKSKHGSFCKDCHKAYLKEHYQKNKKNILLRNKNWMDENPKKAASYGKKYRDKRRRQLIDAYGGICSCCGESRYEFMALDHKFNDGNKERKQFSKRTLHNNIRKKGYPKDRYQLLCHNCNAAKSLYGICPHDRERINQ